MITIRSRFRISIFSLHTRHDWKIPSRLIFYQQFHQTIYIYIYISDQRIFIYSQVHNWTIYSYFRSYYECSKIDSKGSLQNYWIKAKNDFGRVNRDSPNCHDCMFPYMWHLRLYYMINVTYDDVNCQSRNMPMASTRLYGKQAQHVSTSLGS